MKVSYQWLRNYVEAELSPDELSAALNAIGLETGAPTVQDSISGGLRGLVVGEVLTCRPHPNSDHLHITTVDIGDGGEPLQIVCGANNVAAGLKVVVAPNGTRLYKGEESVVIKRTKIRGEESNGMICAEDEIGVGTEHSGIITLPSEVRAGTLASDYYGVASDYVLEVDITPNRVDAASHYGVARDLAAYLKQHGKAVVLKRPSVDAFKTDASSPAVQVIVENTEACPRYTGVTIRGVRVEESPKWLQQALRAIGLRPVNNVVDVTNYVLHELGQPLHAFDADKIRGGKVIAKTLPAGTRFVTLDGVERTLSDKDLMICDGEGGMCIGGVFGGLASGVTEGTTNVFLESANFNASWIRKTARRFGLSTDASFRFERGLDPNQTPYALQRAALLIKETAGGTISGKIQDVYPTPVGPYRVELAYDKINRLTGNAIPAETVKEIAESLEMEIVEATPAGLTLHVPRYRTDVSRDVDVIEDILRIYGYERIVVGGAVRATLHEQTSSDRSYYLQRVISEQLCGEGFSEILNNSLTRPMYYEGLSSYPLGRCVRLQNPISVDLSVMRQTLLFGGLESIGYNEKRKNGNIRFFEFGNCYACDAETEKQESGDPLAAYSEDSRLGLWVCGKRVENHWAHADEPSSVYELKAYVENVLRRLGVSCAGLVFGTLSDDIYAAGQRIVSRSGRALGALGVVNKNLCQRADTDAEVYYAELSWTALMKEVKGKKIVCSDLSKYPAVKRDLALLLDKRVAFAEIERVAFESEKRLLRAVRLFDVYEGKNVPEGKKSYGVSFYLQDDERTLNEKQIDGIMQRLQTNMERQLGAQVRDK